MDVPTEETSSPRQLVRPFAKPLSNDQSIADSATFCSTCLKNQHLLTQTLANYLPPPSDPTYDQYEASYPDFRQQLEERYPQVCKRCEPEVRRRIQQAGYTAKSDHLRRMMERSRARRVASTWGWRSLLVTLGALFFWASTMGQLAWNLVVLMENPKQSSSLAGTALASRLVTCAAQVFKDSKTESGCATAFAPIGFIAIVFGLLSSWWNPKWQHKLQGCEGRLTGLLEYYQMNTAVLLARFGFWIRVRESTMLSSNEQKLLHCLAMFMTALLTVYTLTRVKIDTTPLVSWQDSPVHLLSRRQFNPPVAPGMSQSAFSSHVSRSDPQNAQPFPISSLDPGPKRQIWQAPTPPPDEDIDAMEWEPSQTFQPNPRRPKVKAPPGPSPFHGALPAMPTNRWLHPQSQRQPAQKEAIGLPPGFFDKRDRLKSGTEPGFVEPMAQPKFFSRGDHEADTGLESIFDAVFSLRDPSAVSKASADRSNSPGQEHQEQKHRCQNMFDIPDSAPHKPWYSSVELNIAHVANLIVLSSSSLMFYVALKLQLDVPHIKLGIICIAGLVPLFSALSQSKISTRRASASDAAWSLLVLLAATYLLFRQWSHIYGKADETDDQMGMIFLFLCSCWEAPRLLEWNASWKLSPDLQANHVVRGQMPESAASRAWGQPHQTPSYAEMWRSSTPEVETPGETQSLELQEPRWEPEERFPPKPASSLQTREQTPFYRTRSDSMDSASSQSSSTTVGTTTTAGWNTPKPRAQHPFGVAAQSPGFNLRSLALDDGMPTPRRREQSGFGTRSRTRG